ncbi:hypothetical protein HBN50_14645 [Halobacteriovorax sp. GB3]|uniref:hypothetical protein n=1 Tax=Halobacteriovorax sp. GB3 TaxID=2719615 RepID=UPI00235EC588|nr:hypothetical protein [Halobacteriovorax sp. GB3]MDD0854348.1 hypothetical protein [Halobacteriovorax sp. GB3]
MMKNLLLALGLTVSLNSAANLCELPSSADLNVNYSELECDHATKQVRIYKPKYELDGKERPLLMIEQEFLQWHESYLDRVCSLFGFEAYVDFKTKKVFAYMSKGIGLKGRFFKKMEVLRKSPNKAPFKYITCQ